MELSRLYARRFSAFKREQKARAWDVLYRSVFSHWIRPSDTVLDLGAGYCEFINSVSAHRRIAVDVNSETARFAVQGVEVHINPAADLSFLGEEDVNFVFSSNFLEHLQSKHAVTAVAEAAFRVLRPGGLIVLMGPNIRLLPGVYWDFYDHHVPLSDRSVCELLTAVGFEIRSSIARFAPYTVLRWPVPIWSWTVGAYLALRPLSSALLGKQFLVTASKPDK